MSSKKIVDELKKYNKELERHIPGLDIDVVRETKIFQNAQNEDYFTLFAENLMDLRTELALLRKNISTDVEGMVLRVINEQQNKFKEQMNNFYVKAILDVKENGDRHLSEFADEVSDLKHAFNEMRTQNDNLAESIGVTHQDVLLLKSSLKTLDFKSSNHEIDRRLDKIMSSLSSLSRDMSSINNKIEDNYSHLNKKLLSVSNQSKILKHDFDKKIEESKRAVEEVSKNQKSFTSVPLPVENSSFDLVSDEIEDAVLSDDTPSQDFSISKSSKLLEIESRLDKLNSLRQ